MSKWWHGPLHRLCCTVTVPCSPPSYTTVVRAKSPPPPSKRDQPVIAAVVYTGLRKEPCESGGNCVKSPCELPVRWLADGWVCRRPTAKAGGEAGGEEREGQRGGRGWMLQANQAGSWQSQHARVSSCRKNPVCKTGGGGRLMCALLGG